MVARRSVDETPDGLGLAVHPDVPLIGIELMENGEPSIRYFSDEAEADAVVAAQRAAEARSLAGIWGDLDWDEMSDELDRIRRANRPTPPIDEL